MINHVVIIPTYNEAPNIRPIVEAVMALPKRFHILFVDDNSPDGTADSIKREQNVYADRISLLNRPEKNGLALAYFDGFSWAMDHGFEYIYEMDCDFSHDPKELIVMSSLLENNSVDMVVGSRYIDGIRVSNWSKCRTLLSRFASCYVQLLTRLPIKDATAGYVGYTKNVITEILKNRHNIKMNGYGFQVALKYIAWKKKFRCVEHPITFSERRLGMSKMTGKIIVESILEVPKLPFVRWV